MEKEQINMFERSKESDLIEKKIGRDIPNTNQDLINPEMKNYLNKNENLFHGIAYGMRMHLDIDLKSNELAREFYDRHMDLFHEQVYNGGDPEVERAIMAYALQKGLESEEEYYGKVAKNLTDNITPEEAHNRPIYRRKKEKKGSKGINLLTKPKERPKLWQDDYDNY